MCNVFEISTEDLGYALTQAIQSMLWPDIEKILNALPKQNDEAQRLWDGCIDFLHEHKSELIMQIVKTFLDRERIDETADAIVEELHNNVSAGRRLADVKQILNHLIKSFDIEDYARMKSYAFQHVVALLEMEDDDLYALYGDVLAGGEEHDTAVVGVASQEADSESV